MRVLKVEGLCCPTCAEKIDEALKEAEVDHKVDFEAKEVSVCDCDHCMEVAMDIIAEHGFTAERIR